MSLLRKLVAWTDRVAQSQIVTIPCGEAPTAYRSRELRRLIGNALRFVAGAGSDQI